MTCPFFVPRNDTLTLKWICINFTFSCCVYVYALSRGSAKDLLHGHQTNIIGSRVIVLKKKNAYMYHIAGIQREKCSVMHALTVMNICRSSDVCPLHPVQLGHFFFLCLGFQSKTGLLWLFVNMRGKKTFPLKFKLCSMIKMRIMIKERMGSAASCGVGGADKNRLHYAVHLVNK